MLPMTRYLRHWGVAARLVPRPLACALARNRTWWENRSSLFTATGCNVPAWSEGTWPGRCSPLLVSAIDPNAERGFYSTENLFAPRLGFSFAPFDQSTVIRGGFGIFYDHPEGNV